MLNFKARLIKALKKLGLKVNNKVPDGKDYPEIINSIADSYTGGGTTVVANPELVGTEPNLTGLEVEGIKYKAPEQKQADWNQGNSEAVDYIKNKPTIPSAQIQSDWNQSNNQSPDFIKNKPTIPTVNNSTITFTQGGTTKGSFTLNQSGDGTIALDAGGGGGATGTIVTYTDAVHGYEGHFYLMPTGSTSNYIPALLIDIDGYIDSDWMHDINTYEYRLKSIACSFGIGDDEISIYGYWYDNSSDSWDFVRFNKSDFSGLPK